MGIRGFVRGTSLGLALLAAVSPASLGRSDVSSSEEALPDLSGRWVTIQRLVTIAQLSFHQSPIFFSELMFSYLLGKPGRRL